MRLIDADALVIMLGLKPDEWDTPDERWRPESEFGLRIMNAPTIEPKTGQWIAGAEVIRCKDCVHSDTFPKGADNDRPLKCLGIRYGGVMPDWYCEHAELTNADQHIQDVGSVRRVGKERVMDYMYTLEEVRTILRFELETQRGKLPDGSCSTCKYFDEPAQEEPCKNCTHCYVSKREADE